MSHITGHDRSQTLLLPESLDEYVGPENPVRLIDAFVDGLDLTAAGFLRVASMTRRPGYAPKDLLKLYIYGYLNRVRSSRRLEAETHRNIEVIWLLRHLKPDSKTIADFRRDDRNAFRPIFRQFVLLCRQLDLFGRELLAVDGTQIKAVNNKDRNFTRASLQKFIELADAKLDDDLQRLDQSDATESKTGGSRVKNLAEKIAAIRERRTRCKDMLAQLDQTGEDQISLTDPDSRANGGAHACCRGLQRSGRGGHQAQADRGAAGHQPGRRHGQGWPKVPPSIAWWNGQTRVADADRRTGEGGSRCRDKLGA
jgi:transposase